MALAAVERERHLQRETIPERESSWPFESYDTPHEPGTFLDTLNPSDPRPPADEIGEPFLDTSILDISVLTPGMLDVYHIAVDPELRGKINSMRRGSSQRRRQEQGSFSRSSGSVVFQQDRERIVEAGHNSYRNPVDRRNYSATPLWETYDTADTVLYNLRDLNDKEYDTTHSDHIHPPTSIPFHSIPALFVFPMHQNSDRNKPFINAQTILGLDLSGEPGVQVTAVSTAEFYESYGLLSDDEVVQEREVWEDRHFDAAGQAAKDQVIIDLAEELRWKFFLSPDMETGYHMPVRELVQLLREKPQAEIVELFRRGEHPIFSRAA
jgi:hypothetical protein